MHERWHQAVVSLACRWMPCCSKADREGEREKERIEREKEGVSVDEHVDGCFAAAARMHSSS